MENTKKIENKNKEITYAIKYSQFMRTEAGKVIKLKMLELAKQYRFQDILGIKEGAFADQKGIALGIEMVLRELDSFEKMAEKPRTDIDTGEKEKMSNKSE